MDNYYKLEIASTKDIGLWMQMVDVVKDNFPGLDNAQDIIKYRNTVLKNMKRNTALCVKSHNEIVGILIFSLSSNCLGCMAVSIGANNFLLYQSILWCKEKNYNWFCVGLFDSIPLFNKKEYNVGHYKAQFSRCWFPAFERRVLYSQRVIKYHTRQEERLLYIK